MHQLIAACPRLAFRGEQAAHAARSAIILVFLERCSADLGRGLIPETRPEIWATSLTVPIWPGRRTGRGPAGAVLAGATSNQSGQFLSGGHQSRSSVPGMGVVRPNSVATSFESRWWFRLCADAQSGVRLRGGAGGLLWPADRREDWERRSGRKVLCDAGAEFVAPISEVGGIHTRPAQQGADSAGTAGGIGCGQNLLIAGGLG